MVESDATDRVICAHRGPQSLLLECPAQEIFFGGQRGGGKSYVIPLDFFNRAYRYGKNLRAIVIRHSYPSMDELVAQSFEILKPLGGKWVGGHVRTWTMPNGATLKMRAVRTMDDARKYQGHQYSMIAIDEAGNYATTDAINEMRACLRNPYGIPARFLLTGNPGGVGHQHLKHRYVDPAPPMTLIPTVSELTGLVTYRVFIPAELRDNPSIAVNDPGYVDRIVEATEGKPWLRKAWLGGDWNAPAGGRFSALWDRRKHVGPGFRIPRGWVVNRSFDWGYSKPYSVGYWAESDGSPAIMSNGVERTFPRGSLIRIGEIYGAKKGPNEKPNQGLRQSPREICIAIKDYEAYLRENTLSGQRIQPGPADTSIGDSDRGRSTESQMSDCGVHWTRANKGPGSRLLGFRQIDELLKAPLDQPQIYVFEECTDFCRTVPVAPVDEKNVEDVDTKSEDHNIDEFRYRVLDTTARPGRTRAINVGG